jgi:hypothetical protein
MPWDPGELGAWFWESGGAMWRWVGVFLLGEVEWDSQLWVFHNLEK